MNRNAFKPGLIEDLFLKLNVGQSNKNCSTESDINYIIDEINAVTCGSSTTVPSQEIDRLLRDVCSSIPLSNFLLLAKCCQLALNLHNSACITFSESTVKAFLERLSFALKHSADICFLDILELHKLLISKYSQYVCKEEVVGEVVSVLVEDIESHASLVDPHTVRLARLQCLVLLAPSLTPSLTDKVAAHFLLMLYHQQTDNLYHHSQIWRTCLEGLGGCRGTGSWLGGDCAGRLVGALMSALHLGLGPSPSPAKPMPLQPAPLPQPPPNPPPPNKTPTKKTKSWRQKVKQVGLGNREAEEGCGIEAFSAASDSDYSDSEGGRLAKQQAAVRLSAANLLIHILKVGERKVWSGWYAALLSEAGLQLCLRNEACLRPCLAMLRATRALLASAKPYLALAQYSESSSYVPYGEVLSELLVSLHRCLWGLLPGATDHTACPLLQCLATLVSSSPYHRLPPSMLATFFTASQVFFSSKQPRIVVAVLNLWNALVSIDPPTKELSDLLKSGPNSLTNSSEIWISAFLLDKIKEQGEVEEAVRVAWWQLMGALFQHQCPLAIPYHNRLLNQLLPDLSSPLRSVQNIAFSTVISLLDYLRSSPQETDVCVGVWNRLVGILVPLLQDASPVAGLACTCLSHMTHNAFYALPDQKQILIMALLSSCCYHLDNSVRSAAIQALGNFLLFPLMANEPYLYDVMDILLKAVSDTCSHCRFRTSWALGNFAEVLKTKGEEDEEIPLVKLLEACMKLSEKSSSKDEGHTRACVARTIGCLLSQVEEHHLEQTSLRQSLDQAVLFLINSATSATFMKLRWNACYAIGSVFKNEYLYPHSSNWFERVVLGLNKLLVKCSHFKVRVQACAALCCISGRTQYGALYIHVWEAILDGLDNSANMPDFTEYKHQDLLIYQLCAGLCHLVSLVEEPDLPGVSVLLEFRQDSVAGHMARFLNHAPPERTSVAVQALHAVLALNTASPHPVLCYFASVLTSDATNII